METKRVKAKPTHVKLTEGQIRAMARAEEIAKSPLVCVKMIESHDHVATGLLKKDDAYKIPKIIADGIDRDFGKGKILKVVSEAEAVKAHEKYLEKKGKSFVTFMKKQKKLAEEAAKIQQQVVTDSSED